MRYLKPYLLGIAILLLSVTQTNSEKPLRSPCNIRYPSDSKIDWYCYRIKKGESLEKLFGNKWIDVARFNRIDRRHARAGISIKVPRRLEDIKGFSPLPTYYEPAQKDKKFILIDLSEQFLGAYEYGKLVFSAPVSTGERENETPTGDYMVTAFNKRHKSSIYFVEKTNRPYPMHYGLRFHISKDGIAYWIHGRDIPGYPASHGCVGLYDEEMQKSYYGFPKDPVLQDSREILEWVVSPLEVDKKFHILKNGPKVRIIGHTP